LIKLTNIELIFNAIGYFIIVILILLTNEKKRKEAEEACTTHNIEVAEQTLYPTADS